MEHGPTTTSSRSSVPARMRAACLRPSRTVRMAFGGSGSSSCRIWGGTGGRQVRQKGVCVRQCVCDMCVRQKGVRQAGRGACVRQSWLARRSHVSGAWTASQPAPNESSERGGGSWRERQHTDRQTAHRQHTDRQRDRQRDRQSQ
ncbi:hypothetical protein BC831DRAFT_440575 [Entophlyctis helioformis]|nr:hypothetical protein BC831DRAFT_440575 [Entophlyctis helioformis]